MRDQRERSHTKKGPGRYAGRGKMVTIRPLFDDVRIVREPRQRLAPEIVGGNWQGQEYLSYAEHDACVRATLDPLSYSGSRAAQYQRAKEQTILERRVSARLAELPITIEG